MFVPVKNKLRKLFNRKTAIACVAAVVFAAAMIVVAKQHIEIVTAEWIVNDPAELPNYRTGLLLGCAQYLSDGRENLFFRYRMEAALRLFRENKIDYLIVSGDNSTIEYDEPTAMKNWLVARGVPAEYIYCDYAGFRTLDSVVRAREIFEQSQLVIISQPFHNQRAVFIARKMGIDAVGFNAAAVQSGAAFKTHFREQFARVKTLLDVYVLGTPPKYFGSKIVIGVDPPE